ncbi:L-threonylcarbamoyladenylate synthase [Deinococcus arcticus]|uniref:L-threonylcarbamoyladenylate synthase n=1 Tax=Deinococcus arcticus TaxID=2136176 RepID=A0A2T3W3R0_9DEIO|nr:L-threonylcarbamoyladenylate synthase [Deinococcus arcticus]PTA66525.1 translation factor Sua5 [Deinococcus arcticus]
MTTVSSHDVQRALQVLAAGGVVAYPSETVWGLAAHPDRPDGIRRLYDLKGRLADKPVQVSCASAASAQPLAAPEAGFEALSAALVPFWPGPLTVVLPASAACPPLLAPEGRVGIRVPDHPVALALLEAAGGVLATTSCNPSRQPPALTHGVALAMNLGDVVLPDGGVPCLGVPSTVLLLPEGRVLREGALPAGQVLACLGAQARGAL